MTERETVYKSDSLKRETFGSKLERTQLESSLWGRERARKIRPSDKCRGVSLRSSVRAPFQSPPQRKKIPHFYTSRFCYASDSSSFSQDGGFVDPCLKSYERCELSSNENLK